MTIHTGLAAGSWYELSLMEQLANIGTDVERAIRWKNKGNKDRSQQAFLRALDLISLTIIDKKHRKRLKELTRTRELLIDYFMYDNIYCSTDKLWQDYFYPFNYATALRSGK